MNNMAGRQWKQWKDELNSEHASYSGSMAQFNTADDFNSGAIPSMQSLISHGVKETDDIMPYNSASAQGCDFNIFNPPASPSFDVSQCNGLNSSSREINS